MTKVEGKYRHFKGTTYRAIGTATCSETGRRLVLYTADMNKSQNGGYDLAIWARPYDMFFSYVEVDGVQTPRFEKIEDV